MTAQGPALPATPGDRGVRAPLDTSGTSGVPAAIDRRGRVLSASRLREMRRAFGRRHLGLVVGALIALWLVLVFSRAVTEAAAVNEDADAVRQQIAELRERLDDARREVAVIQSGEFVLHRSRAFGMGETGERVFSLEPGAPPAPQIRPLGEPVEQEPTTPLEDWIALLFGG